MFGEANFFEEMYLPYPRLRILAHTPEAKN